jgi:hypothetical protein
MRHGRADLIEMMVLIGLRVTFAEIAGTIRDWRLLARE